MLEGLARLGDEFVGDFDCGRLEPWVTARRRGVAKKGSASRGGGAAAGLMRDAWRRWRCQTWAGAASHGEETTAAAALCKTGKLEVGDELEGLGCKNRKVQGLHCK